MAGAPACTASACGGRSWPLAPRTAAGLCSGEDAGRVALRPEPHLGRDSGDRGFSLSGHVSWGRSTGEKRTPT